MTVEEGRTPGGVAYTVRGSGPPLLWMSGYVVPVAAFNAVVDELADSFTVVCVDHRGSGDSRLRLWLSTTGTMAADVMSVLDRLGVESAHVVGISLGGMVAQEVAIGWPHRVRTLVLCSTTAGGRGAKRPRLGDLLGELTRTVSRVPDDRARLRVLGAVQQAAAASTHDATGQLDRILAPTLVVHGGSDTLVPVGNATWLASHIGGARLEVVPGGSHLVMFEPTAGRQLRGWLEEHVAHEPDAEPPTARQQLRSLAGASHRFVVGQTLPLRRAVAAAGAFRRAQTNAPVGELGPIVSAFDRARRCCDDQHPPARADTSGSSGSGRGRGGPSRS